MSEKVIIIDKDKQIDINTLMGFDKEIPMSMEMFLSEEQWHDEYYGVDFERLMPSDHNVCCTKRYKRSNKDKEYIKRKR